MKRVIDGKLYDTDTAEMIDSDGYDNDDDFNACYEELYKTKSGRFFLMGTGYRRPYCVVNPGGGCSYGRKIVAIEQEEAQRWMEDHSSAATYAQVFGEPEGA